MEIQNAFNNAIDKWCKSPEIKEDLSTWLGLSYEEYVNVVTNPTDAFYIFYHNDRFQDVLLSLVEN